MKNFKKILEKYAKAGTQINSETYKNNGKLCYYFQIEPIYPQKENVFNR